MELHNKLVLITGGSGGIGEQIAADLLRAGSRVIIASNDHEHLQQSLGRLQQIQATVVGAVQCDVGSAESVVRMSEAIMNQYGCPDVLVNCAGFATYRTFEATSMSETEDLISVNLVGPMRCAKVFLPHFVAQRSGAIVNMASIAGRMVITPNGTYSAAKHALVAWSEVLQLELRRFNIQVNVVCPGRVETPFFDHETFRTRLARPETQRTVPVQSVSRATLDAIRRDRFLTYVPGYLAIPVWLLNALPFLSKPVYSALLGSRIESLYRGQQAVSGVR